MGVEMGVTEETAFKGGTDFFKKVFPQRKLALV